jgi:hypothetical protein
MSRLKITGFLVLAIPVVRAEIDTGRGVARVSLINGEVTVQRGESGDWIAAAINAPLVTGDKIHTDRASRAEVQLDYSNFLRLAESTDVRLAELENRRYQVQVSRGIVTYRILRDPTAQVELNTPALAVRPLERGAYRIEVRENGETEITVRDGEAEIYTSRGTERLHEGRTMIARVGASDREVEVQVRRAAGRDDWDRWNERRDNQIRDARSNRYVHSSVWGVEDLDAYGDWRYVDDYGWCWYPRHIHVGWSPYSWGRWAWVDWYGWSWIGYEPWGWAPYHWGRWWRHPSWGWGWYPGPVYRHHYWSPAVVGFFGWGSRLGFGFGVGFGYSNVGWVPLAPGDSFYPWWGRGYYGRGSRGHIDNSIHITNISNIRNVYRNAGVNGGIVSVNTEDFARGRVVNPRRVSVAEVGNAGQIRGLVPVVPEQESIRVSDRPVRATPRTEGRDRFFMRQQPQAVERVPFQEQRALVERSVRSAAETGRRAESETGRLQDRGTAAVERSSGWRRAGEERRTPEASAAPQQVERSTGWRRFGEERRTPEVSTGPQQTERSTGWRRMGEERRPQSDVVVRPQATDRGVDRSGGWRRLGEERRAEPQAVTPPPAVERRSEPDSGFRRFGGRDREVEMQRFPSAPREQLERREEPRREAPRIEPRVERDSGERSMRGGDDVFRRSERSEPRMREERWGGGGGRQIEPHRPIVVPRGGGGGGARGDGGGGVRGGAGAPRGGGGEGGGRVRR